jgi:predicted nucleotide-binding protein
MKINESEIELPATELRLAPRARENVWVEVGWFWGRQRVFLWLKDAMPLPSDLQGAAWIRGDLSRAWPHIQRFITNLRKRDKSIRNE